MHCRHASRIQYDTVEAMLGTVLVFDDPTAVASFTEGWWMSISVRWSRTYGEPDGGLGDGFLPLSERQLHYILVKCHAIYVVADRWIEMIHEY